MEGGRGTEREISCCALGWGPTCVRSPYIARAVNHRRLRSGGHMARKTQTRILRKILVGKLV